MTTDLATIVDGETVARVLLHGDLQKLTASQKVAYYSKVCETLGFNPLTRPFEYIILNGKETLYAKREATEQLRRLHKVSLTITARELVETSYIVTARATLPDGRTDESIGVKALGGLTGEARADAMMTAETKAKRRVTLSICGLGMLDETEVADIPPTPMGSYDTRVAPPPSLAAGAREARATVTDLDAHEQAALDNLSADDNLPDGVVRVVRIDSAPTKNPNVTRYLVTLSTGETASTINTVLANLAQAYCEQGTPVRAVLEPTKWGRPDLKKLTPADAPPSHPEPPPPVEDQPF